MCRFVSLNAIKLSQSLPPSHSNVRFWRNADQIRTDPALNQRLWMRPSLLNPLFATAVSLPGIGPKTAKLLDRLLAKDAGEARAIDLLFHLPYAAIDRRNRPKIADAPLDTIVTLDALAALNSNWRVLTCSDNSGRRRPLAAPSRCFAPGP